MSIRASVMVGYHHMKGLGVKQNYKQALKLFEKAAEKNEPMGINGLGKENKHFIFKK